MSGALDRETLFTVAVNRKMWSASRKLSHPFCYKLQCVTIAALIIHTFNVVVLSQFVCDRRSGLFFNLLARLLVFAVWWNFVC